MCTHTHSYTLLVGRPPFETESLKDTYQRIKRNEYRVPSHVSIEARVLITKLLRPDPATRPTTTDILSDPFMTVGYMPSRLPQRWGGVGCGEVRGRGVWWGVVGVDEGVCIQGVYCIFHASWDFVKFKSKQDHCAIKGLCAVHVHSWPLCWSDGVHVHWGWQSVELVYV